GPRKRRSQTRQRRADRAPARARLPRRPWQAAHRRAVPDGRKAGAAHRGPRHAIAVAAWRAAPAGAHRARPESARASSREVSHDVGRAGSRLAELAGIADAGRREMRTATALAAGHRGDGIRDVTRFDAFGHQIIRDGHVDARPLAFREQHGNSAFVLRAEAVHENRDLIAILEIGFRNVQFVVTVSFDASLVLRPPSSQYIYFL